MIMDYCEQEILEGKVQLHIGLQFEDEPDSLYVAELEVEMTELLGSGSCSLTGLIASIPFVLRKKKR